MSNADGHDVVVVGAGIAGLSAAWQLRDLDVLVLEREDRIGGRIWSERRGDYWLNFGAHVFGSADSATGRLLADTGVRAVHVPGRLTADTANVLRADGRARARGGSLMVYAAADAARRIARLDDGSVAARFVEELNDLLPDTRGIVEEVVIRRWQRGLPYPRPGRSLLQTALTRSLAPIYLAADYLGTWYTETAVQTAARAAAEIRRRLGAEQSPLHG